MIEIERTDDGSNTIFVPELDEHYHSTKGAFTESKYIFIEQGFNHSAKNSISILEIGFGTGLNAILTYIEAEKRGVETIYDSIEKYPLKKEIVDQLNYLTIIGEENRERFDEIHNCQWDNDVTISPFFTLHKINGDFTSYNFSREYDVIYFDAFAPEKQPEMWTQEIFDDMYRLLRPEGVITTYCAKGIIRRMLQAAGFKVERLPGPPNGKREILRATKI